MRNVAYIKIVQAQLEKEPFVLVLSAELLC